VLVIRRFDDAAVTAAPDFSKRELLSMYKVANQDLPPPALLAYRLYPNGKEELVRGAQLGKTDISAWKDVVGTSTELTAYNYLASTETQLSLKLASELNSGGAEGEGFVPSGGVESGIVTPDLLVKDLVVHGANGGDRALPVVPQPAVAAAPAPAPAPAPAKK
jgi:hypothetical protein